jgi:hypothetical protein
MYRIAQFGIKLVYSVVLSLTLHTNQEHKKISQAIYRQVRTISKEIINA